MSEHNTAFEGSASTAAEATRRSIYRGRVVDLGVEELTLPNGEEVQLEVVRHQGAAAVVPLTDSGEVLMIRQYRHATGGWLLEIPAGKLDPGESPEEGARREVEEEVGYRPGRLRSLGWIWSSPGFTDERIWLYLATELQATSQRLEADEVLEVLPVPLAQALAWAGGGPSMGSPEANSASAARGDSENMSGSGANTTSEAGEHLVLSDAKSICALLRCASLLDS